LAQIDKVAIPDMRGRLRGHLTAADVQTEGSDELWLDTPDPEVPT